MDGRPGWDSSPPRNHDGTILGLGGRNRKAGADGDTAGGPAGDDGAVGNHASSERSSSLLACRGLPPPSVPSSPKASTTEASASARCSGQHHREHGRLQ